jgi:tryptophan 7-halogenase
MKDIIVVGGGTAGWITALSVKHSYPDYNVTVVASSNIGILGAGEGTTPHFVSFLKNIGIDVSELIKETNATLKIGIEFVNWSKKSQSYFHPFDSTTYSINYGLRDLYATQLVSGNLNKICFGHYLSAEKKVPIHKDTAEHLSSFALHFDARLLAEYLEKVALDRGIKCVDAEVKNISAKENGQIEKLILNNGDSIALDFVFDCSGFKRLILGSFYNATWRSYSDILPMNSAAPFFLPIDETVKPVTEAIAMKYGWVWKIPTKNRYGCGYVFDSNYISKEEAIKEVEDYFGTKIDSPTCFSFEAGAYEQVLVNNCMAIGLSQGFIEPLEATSIWTSLEFLDLFLREDGINNTSPYYIEEFNKNCLEFTENIKNFIHFHYLCDRNDSLFWREFRDKNPTPEIIKKNIGYINSNTNLKLSPEKIGGFAKESWLYVGAGLESFDVSIFKELLKNVDKNVAESRCAEFKGYVTDVCSQCISHQDLLDDPKCYGL